MFHFPELVWCHFKKTIINKKSIFTAENSGESLRKELTDVRRQLADCNYEKEKYNSSNKELREIVKRCESEKREQARMLEETFQKISSKYLFLESIRQNK